MSETSSHKEKLKQLFNSKKSFKVLFSLILISCLVVILSWLIFANSETTDNAQVTGNIVNIASRIDGQITKIYVENNTPVKAGDPLVKLDDSIQLANLDAAQADFDAAVAGFKQATIDVKQARANFLAAQSAKDLAYKNLNRGLSLEKQNAISQLNLDQQKNQYDQAVANFEAAKAVLYMSENMFKTFGNKFSTSNKDEFLKYAKKMKGFNPALDSAIAKLLKAKSNLELANLNLDYTVIKAPLAGFTGNKTAEVGANVNPSVPLMSVVASKTWIVANFKETQMKKIKNGSRSTIKIDSYGSKKFEGVVTSISPATGEVFALLPPDNASGNFVKVTQRVPVRIDFKTAPDEAIKPGMSAEVTVDTK